MMRRPFASLLVVAGLGVALALALLLVTLPPPMRALAKHCVDAGGACRSLVLAVRAVGSPVLLLSLLAQLLWSAQHGLREGWRQWRATHAALDYLSAQGRRAPDGALAVLGAGLGMAGRVEVVVNSTPLVLCHGVWRPRVWLSSGALAVLGPAELRAVLRHERAHQRRRDPLRLLVARCCAAALPHLPVLHELAATLPLTQELAADRAAIRDEGRGALGRALLALSESGATATPALATSMVNCLDARIDQLTGTQVALPGLSRRAMVRTGGVLAGGLLLLTALIASGPPAPPLGPGRGHDMLGSRAIAMTSAYGRERPTRRGRRLTGFEKRTTVSEKHTTVM